MVFFIECLTHHSARAILLTASRIVQACLYGWALQTFQISAESDEKQTSY